jgi:hypothetical protein
VKRGSQPAAVAVIDGADPVLASRPKTSSAAKVTASGAAKTVPLLQRSPQQMHADLLQGQWTSRGKPATLLPSEITFCSAAGSDINCWSIPQKTDTKYGKALYKVEAQLGVFEADGSFRLTYRTLVKLLARQGVADDSTPASGADDQSGWQVTQRSMDCELSTDRVVCRGAKGTVREYRKRIAGRASR